MSLARFGVTKPVPANLLMFALLLGGLVASFRLTREFFPDVTPKQARIAITYPGATPEEIEESMARKIEDKLDSELGDKIERITTNLAEGGGGVTVEFRDGVDVGEGTDEVERALDTLTDLPDEAERLQVSEFEPILPVIVLQVYGDADEEVKKRTIRRIRDDLKSLPRMGDVVTSGVRDYEIRVDVDAPALVEHRVSLPAVADAISRWMADVPGGSVRTGVGNVNVRTIGVEESAETIRRIPVKATAAGQVLRVGDIAEVREGYVDTEIALRFDGRPSASLTVYKVGDQDAVEMAEMVRYYAAGAQGRTFEDVSDDRLGAAVDVLLRTPRKQAYDLGARISGSLPASLSIGINSDLARFIEGRLDLLTRNAFWGGILVFGTLLVFLNWRVAVWVGVGLLTAMCGTLMVMQALGITLNLLTMFGLIVVIGLLVDDAIVVAENIQARHDRNEPSLVAAIRGTEQVFWPVVATILTSIVAFLPLTFVEGQIGDLISALPWVVACALVMSLVESLLVLPSHMGHSLVHRDRAHPGRAARAMRRFEAWRDRMIFDRVVPAYSRLLAFMLRYRYASLAAATGVLIASVGMVAGRRVEFTFLPTSDAETIVVEIRMPIGTSFGDTERTAARIEEIAARQPEARAVETLVGASVSVDDTSGVELGGVGSNQAQLFIELLPTEQRDIESSVVIDNIRREVGVLPDVESLSYSEIGAGPGGPDITVEIAGEDFAQIEAAVEDVKRALVGFDGVFDVADNRYDGQREVQIRLRPGAAAAGLSLEDVAQQVRGALFGLDAHVFSASREDIDVRVRLDEVSRRSLARIENMWLVTPAGARVPLGEVAELVEGTSYASITRIDRRRAVSVTADTAPGTNPEQIVPLLAGTFDEIRRRSPELVIDVGGRQREMAKAFASLPVGFLAAAVGIYVILAWLFSSFTQPFAVMLGIPFAIIGVIWGHFLLGYQMTFLSLIGFVALSGIVVNDSLILVEFFNARHREGASLRDALGDAGRQRLRPIFLTTITTVLGLTPLMLEQSFQAKFLIPMAIAISFGLMSATVLILLLLPCILVIFDDVKATAYLFWHGRPRGDAPPGPSAEELLDLIRE